FQIDRAADHVTAGEVFDVRRVAFHETLAAPVDQHAALAAHAFGDQDAHLVNAGRVELEELQVLKRHAAPVNNRRAVTGQAVRVARHRPDAPPTAGRKQRRLAVENVQLAGAKLDGD